VQGEAIMQINAAPPRIAMWDVDIVSQPTDEELLTSIAGGDKRALGLLLARHKVRVYRFALRLINDASVAEDLVSETFFEVWRHAGRFEGRSRVSTWLLGITRNLALTILRRRSTEEPDDGVAELIEDSGDNPETALHKAQRSSVLAHCLTRLSPAHREIIDLVYYHGKSIDEVAEIVCIPHNTVKTRMFYARTQLGKLLKGYGYERSEA
jgi:RNA polymerase sigma-70 factor (ECF subfamily)